MPNKYNHARRHHIPRAKYKIGRWAEVDASLRRRGSLTLWISDEAIAGREATPASRPAGSLTIQI